MSVSTSRAPDSHVDVAITPTVDSVDLAKTVIRWRGIEDTIPAMSLPCTWPGSPQSFGLYLYQDDDGELALIYENTPETVDTKLPPGASLLTRIASWSLREPTDTPETVEIHRVVIVPEPEPEPEEEVSP